MAPRCRHVYGAMAGTGNVCLAALLDALERSDLASRLVMRATSSADELLELVVEAFRAEIPLLLSDPLLQTEMRLDDELGQRYGIKTADASLAWRRRQDWAFWMSGDNAGKAANDMMKGYLPNTIGATRWRNSWSSAESSNC
jgi:hypothetical protein